MACSAKFTSQTCTQAAELEAALAERTRQMSEAETTLKLKEMEFERRVTSLQKEHASKVATVLSQVAVVAPAGSSPRPSTQGMTNQYQTRYDYLLQRKVLGGADK